MRNFSAFFLTLLFLMSALLPVQLREELGKLPSLLEHYREHRSETPQISFLQFLELHYGEQAAAHNGAHDHSDLPMKNGCNHLHVPVQAFLPIQDIPTGNSIIAVDNQLPVTDQSYSFLLLHDIWQPPQA